MHTTVETGNGRTNMGIAYGDIQLGPYTLKQHVILIGSKSLNTKEIDGVIGMNVMDHFRMEIDPKARQIVLHR